MEKLSVTGMVCALYNYCQASGFHTHRRQAKRVSMGNVIVDLSISPDGFIAGPDDGVERPPGAGDERLRDRSHKANDNEQLAVKNVLGDGDLAAVHSRILL
jgi:hypothetical protein